MTTDHEHLAKAPLKALSGAADANWGTATALPQVATGLGINQRLDRFALELAHLRLVAAETEKLWELVGSRKLEKLPASSARLGLELEVHLIDSTTGLPARLNREILAQLDAVTWTPELCKSQIEARTAVASPAGGGLLSMEKELSGFLADANRAAAKLEAVILPAGFLPTLTPSDLGQDSLSDLSPRYAECNRFALGLRKDRFEGPSGFPVEIRGRDGKVMLRYQAPSIATAGTICSLQPHLQVSAELFVDFMNIAHAISGYVMAPAISSPVIFGKVGWKENRIRLFEQAWDPQRVGFGHGYISSPIDDFRVNCTAGYRPVFINAAQDSGSELAPALPNLRLLNGTIHRWNRSVYDVCKGQPHIRIEHRALSVAAAPIDNIANAAWFWGMAWGMHLEFGDIRPHLLFAHARENFYAAAKDGLEAKLHFPGQAETKTMLEMKDWLVGVCRKGLEHLEVDATLIERYLGVIQRRIETGITEADWIERMYLASDGPSDKNERLAKISLYIARASQLNMPITDRPLDWSKI